MGKHLDSARSRAFTALVIVVAAVLLVPTAGLAAPKNANPLAVSVTSSPNPVVSGAELTYTITVTNTGGSAIDQVVTTDQVNGLTGIDGTNNLVLTNTVGTCTQSANAGGMLVRCEHGTMAGFQAATITIRGRVTAAAGTVLNNTATTTATKSAQTVSRSATTSTQVTGGSGPLADLGLTISAPSNTPSGSDYYATLTVNNTGTANASDVVVTATVPANAGFLTSATTSLFTCSDGPGPDSTTLVTCSGGAVNAGANATITLYLQAAATDGQSMTVSATVDPYNTVPESSELNNAGQATTTTGPAAANNTLIIEKSAPAETVQYELLTYTVKVTNASTSRADYVTATDSTQGLDASSVAVNVTSAPASPGVACVVDAPLVRCDTTRLQAGQSFTFTVTGRVIQPAGSFIINTATVNGNIRNKGYTWTATGVTTVRPGIDLTVTQHRTLPVLPAPVRAADRFDYAITVGNSGMRDATNVLVREPLPAGVLLDGFTGPAGTTCSPAVPPAAGGVVACTIPIIRGSVNGGQPGGTTEVIVLQLIAPQAIGPITSTVTVDPQNQIAEADESNNTFTTTTDVLTGIDLTINKVDNFDPIARNGTLQYTVTVRNLGTQDSSGIVVRDVLPAGAVFRSASGDHNFTCGHANGVVTCTGGIIRGTYSGSLTLPVETATIIIDVFAPDEPGLAHNEVRVDPANAIPEIDESNNIEFEDTVVENGQANGAYKELSIPSITTNFDPIATSGTLDYTLTVLNTGSADAFNVVVRVALPAGSIYRTANDTVTGAGAFTCSASGGVVTCTGGTITQASGTRQILVRTFAPPSPGTAVLSATVDPDNAIGEANESNNQTDESTVVQAGSPNGVYIDLHVSDIADNFDPVAPAGTLNYDVTIENLGSADAFGVTFRATLPAGATYRGADDQAAGPDAFSCSQASGVVTCTGGRVKAGGPPRVVQIQVFAPNQPGTARLDVVLDPNNAIPEGHEGNNTAEEYTAVQLSGGGGFIDLQIKKDGPNDVDPGATYDYTITVWNVGTDDAFNVLVRDPLPAGTTFVNATADGSFICQQNGGVVECSGGHVERQTLTTRTITIRVKAPLVHQPANPIRNQVFVDPANAIPEASEVNNTAFKDTTVTSKVDLRVEISGGSISTGSTGDIKVKAINDLAGAAPDVTFEFNAPIGTIIQNVTAPPGWSCITYENPVNKVVCSGGLAGNGDAELTVKLYKTAQGSVNANAVVDPGNTVVETLENNNSAQHQL